MIREEILNQLRRQLKLVGVVEHGDFELSSGGRSDFYIDLRRATLHSKAAWAISEAVGSILVDLNAQAVGGMSLGADPIVGAVLDSTCGRYSESHPGLAGFLIRKESKGYGTKKLIEGPLEPGMRAVVLDDVTTTGNSLLKAVEAVREFGAIPVAAISIVDHGRGAKEKLATQGIPYFYFLDAAEMRGW